MKQNNIWAHDYTEERVQACICTKKKDWRFYQFLEYYSCVKADSDFFLLVCWTLTNQKAGISNQLFPISCFLFFWQLLLLLFCFYNVTNHLFPLNLPHTRKIRKIQKFPLFHWSTTGKNQQQKIHKFSFEITLAMLKISSIYVEFMYSVYFSDQTFRLLIVSTAKMTTHD